jgi:transcriptional regulator with XRE-family HTH domain
MADVELPDIVKSDPELAAIVAHVELARNVSAKLRELRESANLTQKDLAGKLGVSQPRISQAESGKIDETPSIEFIARFAHACEGKVNFSVERTNPFSDRYGNDLLADSGRDALTGDAGKDTVVFGSLTGIVIDEIKGYDFDVPEVVVGTTDASAIVRAKKEYWGRISAFKAPGTSLAQPRRLTKADKAP